MSEAFDILIRGCTALTADPANAYLHSHLAEARQRKLALLRRSVGLLNSKS